jgi:hypothetical protein
LRPAAAAYELGYALEALATTRAAQAEINDFLLGALPSQGTLRVAAQPLTYEGIAAPAASHELSPVPTPRQRLHYRVWAWRSDTAARLRGKSRRAPASRSIIPPPPTPVTGASY